MHAEVRHIHSPDVQDLELWSPPEADRFGILVEVLVGPVGEPGEESFEFLICSPEWMMERYGEDAVILGRHHIILFEWNFPAVKRGIEDLVRRAAGSDWNELATEIARHGRWEFEDYSP